MRPISGSSHELSDSCLNPSVCTKHRAVQAWTPSGVPCIAMRYAIQCAMIKSFRHDGLKRFFRTGSKAGIDPKHAKAIEAATSRVWMPPGPPRT